MPSLKKRVQSQRTPQRERLTVTPYESDYNEKYSSEEEDIKYKVDEPDDINEPKNSSFTQFDEVYSAKLEEISKSQLENTEVLPHGMANEKILVEDVANSKDIRGKNEEKRNNNKKKENFVQGEKEAPESKNIHRDNIISATLGSNLVEDIIGKERKKLPDKEKKKMSKEEEEEEFMHSTVPSLDNITKETSEVSDEHIQAKGETEIAIKPMQSTIGHPTDQITSLTVTNKDDLADQNKQKRVKSVTKQMQDINLNASILSSKTVPEDDYFNKNISKKQDSFSKIIEISTLDARTFESPDIKPSQIIEEKEKCIIINNNDVFKQKDKNFEIEKNEIPISNEIIKSLEGSKNYLPTQKEVTPLNETLKSKIFPPDTDLEKKMDVVSAAEKITFDIITSAENIFLERFEKHEKSEELHNISETVQVPKATEVKTEENFFRSFQSDKLFKDSAVSKILKEIPLQEHMVGEGVEKTLTTLGIDKVRIGEEQNIFETTQIGSSHETNITSKLNENTVLGSSHSNNNIPNKVTEILDTSIPSPIEPLLIVENLPNILKSKKEVSEYGGDKTEEIKKHLENFVKPVEETNESIIHSINKCTQKLQVDSCENHFIHDLEKTFELTNLPQPESTKMGQPMRQISEDINIKKKSHHHLANIEEPILNLSVSNDSVKESKLEEEKESVTVSAQEGPDNEWALSENANKILKQKNVENNVKSKASSSNTLVGDNSKVESTIPRPACGEDSTAKTMGAIPKECDESEYQTKYKTKKINVDEFDVRETATLSLSDTSESKDVYCESNDLVAKQMDSPSKPRVIFRIESEDELTSDAESDWLSRSELASPTHELSDKLKKELKEKFEKEQVKLEERLSRGGIFDISHESLSRTKELVDERLRKISDIKPITDLEDQSNKKGESLERAEVREEIKIGRFHITPTLVEEVINKNKENEIIEKLKSVRVEEEEEKEEIEKELPEKLTEADFEEVIRELKLEGLKTEVYFQSEEAEKEKKKERTLKRVERRFEKMASETLESERREEDRVSEEKLDEKREVEFQRVLSQLSSEEVAESQQEYLQLWEEGGLSSLTPTDDWESRDPDTPENELEEDSSQKPESFGGSLGTGKFGESAKTSESKKYFTSKKSHPSPSKVCHIDKIISPSASNLPSLNRSVETESTPLEIDRSSDFPIQKPDCMSTYDDKRKFWEQMTFSQGGETSRTQVESFESRDKVVEFDKQEREVNVAKIIDKSDKLLQGKTILPDSNGKNIKEKSKEPPAHLLKSYELKDSRSSEEISNDKIKTIKKIKDSSDTVEVSELEIILKTKSEGAPITNKPVISGSIALQNQTPPTKIIELATDFKEKATDENASLFKAELQTCKEARPSDTTLDYANFSDNSDFNLTLSERKKLFEGTFQQFPPIDHPRQLRSLSLPADEIRNSVKAKKLYFEDEMKKEILVERLMAQTSEKEATDEEEEIREKNESDNKLLKLEGNVDFSSSKENKQEITKGLKKNEFHMEKSETEDNEKKMGQMKSIKNEELVPFITVTTSTKTNTTINTPSIGESEDTQSESDVTPEDTRIIDSEDTSWDKSASHCVGLSPKKDLGHVKGIKEGKIGRWIGQEDLSKQIWEADDIDVSQYKVETKWERTRSEGTSPKDRYVCTPEEHFPDTVWEVPIQEQLESEEVTRDIPIEKQIIIEKDEEEQEGKEKIKLTEEEAKKIANEILKYIHVELHNRSNRVTYGEAEKKDRDPENISPTQITNYYLHQVASEKCLSDEDVSLIESAIKDQQEQEVNKLQSSASAISLIKQEAKNEVPTPVEEAFPKHAKEKPEEILTQLKGKGLGRLKDVDIVDQTIAEVKESLEAAQEQLIEQHKKRMKTEVFKKESPSEFEFKALNYEKNIFEDIKERSSEKEFKREIKEDSNETCCTEQALSKKTKFGNRIEKDSKESITKESPDTIENKEKTKFLDSKCSNTDLIKETGEPCTSSEIEIFEPYISKKIEHHSSEDSPRSTSFEENTKSPPAFEEMLSSTSSAERPGESKSGKSEKSDVVFRHSENSTLSKTDRRSGVDLEPYSSSGESHYHSLEHNLSRPCSSDVEGLLAGNIGTAGSSEYESALSHVTSSKHGTATDYKTAISSLSSRESIKSLDSESSGHLASVEVSSEGSETLIPSALELDKDLETPGTAILDDNSLGISKNKKVEQLPTLTSSQISTPPLPIKQLGEDDFEIISESEVVSWAGEVSEDEEGVIVAEEEIDEKQSQKMKRSYEMTFQPEPKPIVFSESLYSLTKENVLEKAPLEISVDENSSIISVPEEKFGSSLDDTGSVLSASLSTTSEASAIRTVVELSRADSEKMDCSLTVSASSADSATREDFESMTSPAQQFISNEISTSTIVSGMNKKNSSVTITLSTSEENGITNVSTQVTSVSRKSSTVDEETKIGKTQSENLSQANGRTQVDYDANYDEKNITKAKKPQGHRRKESAKNFISTMLWDVDESNQQKITDVLDKHKKFSKDVFLTEKEVKNDEKKEADDSEKLEKIFGITEKSEEKKIKSGSQEAENLGENDNAGLLNQNIKSDSEGNDKYVSSFFSATQYHSEPAKQGFFETEKEDVLETPFTPELEDMENKDITPEFSSEAQASVAELELEYSSAYNRRDEFASHTSPIRKEGTDNDIKKELVQENEKVDDGLQSQTSVESNVAEKHELEKCEKEIFQKETLVAKINDEIESFVPEHQIHMQSQKIKSPERQEANKKIGAKTPDAPPSTSSRTSSSSTEQGKEYNVDKGEIKTLREKILNEEKGISEMKDEKELSDSPSSDSFEMIDQPDISDEYVIIEEVGKEAQENDQEGKSIRITNGIKKISKRLKKDVVEEIVVESSKESSPKKEFMDDLKYLESDENADLFSLEFESSSPSFTKKIPEKLKKKSDSKERVDVDYVEKIEQSKKWVEMQFQGEQPAKIITDYIYEMEFERAPLEDIKEEDINELESSSKIGSMGSQKESLGSFSSVKDSFSSTPDFDVLAGRKYFTKSGEHDDVSMSSLQEFELIEKKIMESGKKSGSSSSQDSLNSKKLGTSSKSGQGDDPSTSSLKEFENLENACATVVKMESRAKQEEAILSEIDEGHESQISESESCETVSAVIKEKLESDSEDFDKRMLEMDEIIRQAQSNVDKFTDFQPFEKIESMGRGDSFEEVAKVPDLELDAPFSDRQICDFYNPKNLKTPLVVSKKSTTAQEIRQENMDQSVHRISGLLLSNKPKTGLLGNDGKVKSISVDSLEVKAKERQTMAEEVEDAVSLDSYKEDPQKFNPYKFSELLRKSDSIEECSESWKQQENSSEGCGSSEKEDTETYRAHPRAQFIVGSTDSLDPSSSACTQATYQCDTDSLMSLSFTSGGSNTLMSSSDNLEFPISGLSIKEFPKDGRIKKSEDSFGNIAIPNVESLVKVRKGETFSDISSSHPSSTKKKLLISPEKIAFQGPIAEKVLGLVTDDVVPKTEAIEKYDKNERGITEAMFQREKIDLGSDVPFTSETVELLKQDQYSHIVHKKIQLVPEVEKISCIGANAEDALQKYIASINLGEEVDVIKEIDEHGDFHVKKIIRQKTAVIPTNIKIKENKEILEDDKNVNDFEKSMEGQTSGITSEVQKVVFKGTEADQALQEHIKNLGKEEVEEIVEEDEDGNIHVKKVLRQRVIIRPEELGDKDLTKEELGKFLEKRLKEATVPNSRLKFDITEPFVSEIIEPIEKGELKNFAIKRRDDMTSSVNPVDIGSELKLLLKSSEQEIFGVPSTTFLDPTSSSKISLTEALTSSIKLTEKDEYCAKAEKDVSDLSSTGKKESGISKRPPLVSDISMDDEAEYDTTEHDWRHQLEILHAEADEEEEKEE